MQLTKIEAIMIAVYRTEKSFKKKKMPSIKTPSQLKLWRQEVEAHLMALLK